MECFVGTSGWFYSWNLDGSLDWFVKNSGLNAVELNMSFYRFPFPSMVRSWAVKGGGLRWSIKASRLITHNYKFGGKAEKLWEKFRKLFTPLEQRIDFYLFQLPPTMTPKHLPVITAFIEKTGLGRRFALEPRNIKWFDKTVVEKIAMHKATWVSIDSPDHPLDIYNTNGIVYMRMHGRTAWYSHHYTDEELIEVVEKIHVAKPEKTYVFFNNNHAMLANARRMLELLSRV
ncbi:MAG: DUF72 domain-containing protein [Candidatus Caldarchaeum sp.]